MRICMMSYDYIPNPGGVASHVQALARALVGQGHEVSLLACHLPYCGSVTDADLVQGLRETDVRPMQPHRVLRLIDARRRGRVLRAWHTARPFDIVHYHAWRHDDWAIRCAFGSGGPARVFTNHTSGFLALAANSRRHRSLSRTLRRAHRIIAPSEELRDETCRVGVEAERVRYIPNGVDTQAFAPGDAGPRPPIVLATRRLEHKNGVDLLVRAWPSVLRAHPDTELVLAGDGSERAAVEALAQELGVASTIRFLGSVGRDAIPALYREAALCVLPSRMEAVSISALEAMASGLPVVAAAVGGLPAVVTTGSTGVLVAPESPGSLADGIIHVLGSPDRGRALGRAGRALVESKFSWGHIAELTVAVYRDAYGSYEEA